MSTNLLDHAALESLKEVLADNFDLLLETYLSDGEQRIHALTEAMAQSDWQTVREQSHGLKGSNNNLGIVELGTLCGEIEVQARDMELDGLEQKVASLQQLFAAVRAEIQQYRA